MEERLNAIYNKYKDIFDIKQDEPIRKYTTLRLGGNARLFVFVKDVFSDDIYSRIAATKSIDAFISLITSTPLPLQSLLHDIYSLHIPYYILGGGSDVLFSDDVYEGIVIKISCSHSFDLPAIAVTNPQMNTPAESFVRHKKVTETNQKHDLSFSDLQFAEDHSSPLYVYVEAGKMVSVFIIETLRKNLSGMHWFSHIPASIGGGVFNNIHGGSIFFSEYIDYVVVLRHDKADWKIVAVTHDEMHFAYDHSLIQEGEDIVLGVLFKLYRQSDEEILKAKSFSETWIGQKIQVQPKAFSAGSTFKNLTEEQQEKLGLPTNSAGYLIDQMGLKGKKIGGAQIFEEHGNFFINADNASSNDFKALMDYAIESVKNKYGIVLEPEIKVVNFH
jgi:UDP-N-acetylenolpyruvoylglucosamine reductase